MVTLNRIGGEGAGARRNPAVQTFAVSQLCALMLYASSQIRTMFDNLKMKGDPVEDSSGFSPNNNTLPTTPCNGALALNTEIMEPYTASSIRIASLLTLLIFLPFVQWVPVYIVTRVYAIMTRSYAKR